MSTEKDYRRAEARARKAAVRISDQLNDMVTDLPPTVATQLLLETVIIPELMQRQPWITRLIMEDEHVREAYYAALALTPISPK